MNFIFRENDNLEKELESLNVKVKQIQNSWYKDKKMKSYYKTKCTEKADDEQNRKEELKQSEKVIHELEKQVSDLELEISRETNKIELFADGMYKDEVRKVYMDLLSMGVSINQCEKVVQSVLTNLMNVEVDRLPKKSLASMISIEAHVLSQAQAAEAMLRQEGNCLHLDGTKKRFTEYSGFQVSTHEGTFSLSHQVMPSGDAGSYIKATNETFSELAESISESSDDKEINTAKLKVGIESIMTDRHIVNKKYKRLLEDEKLKSIEIVEGETNTEEKRSKSHINGLFCGLHILPNMATVALNGMKAFEKANNVFNTSIFEANSAGNDLIYEVTKAFIQMSGCQKSGDAVDFNHYLSHLNVQNQLVTFLHNRFNVLFIDGGAVFYHRNHILDYLSSGRSSKNNKLIASIEKLVSNKILLAECRALGIISKLITGPLWRLLENPHISFFDMNDFWQVLVEKISEFSKDSSNLLLGQSIFQEEHAEQDVVYQCLFEKSEMDDLTVSALQNICSAMEPMLRRQLSDQLPGGSLFVPDANTNQNLFMPKTNRISEADFSALDRIDKKAPQKGRCAKSGLITYTVNKTGRFLSQLSTSKKRKYFKIARRVAIKRMVRDKIKNQEVSRERFNKQQSRMQKKQRQKERQVEYLQKLNEQMKEEGVWVSEHEAEQKIQGKTNAKQRLLIRNQILFHSKLLKSKISQKSLLKFQENNKKFNNEKLLENLKVIIRSNFNESVPQKVSDINASIKNNIPKITQKTGRKRKAGHKPNESQVTKVSKICFQKDKFYAIAFMDAWYPGRCLQVLDDKSAIFDFLIPSGNNYKWPLKNDIQKVYVEGALSEVNIEPVSNGRLWSVVDKMSIDRLFKN